MINITYFIFQKTMFKDFDKKIKKIDKYGREIKEDVIEEYEKLEKKTEEVGEKIFASSIFWGVLSYLGILCLIPLLLKRRNRFAQFHSKQGLLVFILSWFIKIPVIGWVIGLCLGIIWIIVIIQVFRKKYWEIPLIGALAKKLKI